MAQQQVIYAREPGKASLFYDPRIRGIVFQVVLVALLAPTRGLTWTVSIACLIGLAALGAIGARLGGSSILKPTLRVTFWGAVAMAATAIIGALVGRAV